MMMPAYLIFPWRWNQFPTHGCRQALKANDLIGLYQKITELFGIGKFSKGEFNHWLVMDIEEPSADRAGYAYVYWTFMGNCQKEQDIL